MFIGRVMSSVVHPMGMFSRLAVIAVALFASASFMEAQSVAPDASSSQPSLDFEVFKTQVLPIFLKRRSPDHARCYACHSRVGETGAPPAFLMRLSPGSTSWNDEQAHEIFAKVSKLVNLCDPMKSWLLLHPLAPEVGGFAVMEDSRVHPGGRQFESRDDPDWKTLAAWVQTAKCTSKQ